MTTDINEGPFKQSDKLIHFNNLIQIIKKLRDPNDGCPWDLKQTHKSLLKYLVEEAYEFIHEAEEGNSVGMEEELGDVLLQVLLHAQIGSENSRFDLESVSKVLEEKLIRRHPHIFRPDDVTATTTEEVVTNWKSIKQSEKTNTKQKKGLIDKSYLTWPALFSAYKIGNKTNDIGFDWESPREVIKVVQDEWEELSVELQKSDSEINLNRNRIEEELGDFIFSVAQLARHLGFDPETTLRAANKKFIGRFNLMEKMIIEDGISLPDLNQKEMDLYWNKVKHNEK